MVARGTEAFKQWMLCHRLYAGCLSLPLTRPVRPASRRFSPDLEPVAGAGLDTNTPLEAAGGAWGAPLTGCFPAVSSIARWNNSVRPVIRRTAITLALGMLLAGRSPEHRTGHLPFMHMHSLSDFARTLNRPTVVVSGVQTRFELPVFQGAAYSDAYLAFLKTVLHLRTLGISEDRLLRCWFREKKLLKLIHADTTGSPTWFLDSCGATSHRRRRLLLSNYDIGIAVPSGGLQLGLDFAEDLPELFAGAEMGEDLLRLLKDYSVLYAGICDDVAKALSQLRATVNWAAPLAKGRKRP